MGSYLAEGEVFNPMDVFGDDRPDFRGFEFDDALEVGVRWWGLVVVGGRVNG